MSTSERMLRLLSLLQTHRYWPGPELSSRLEVSERTVRRDVERLRELGYQVDAVRGSSGGYQLRAGGSMPPLLLEDEEAVAVAVGLRSAATSPIAGTDDWSVQALTKVIALMPPRLRRRMDAVSTQVETPGPWSGAPRFDADVLTTLAQACRDGELVRFGYVAREGEATDRRVEPHRLVSLGRRWYLVAYDRDRLDWRSFRLDRVADPRPTGDRFRPREIPAPDAVSFVRQGIRRMPQRYAVAIRFDAAADLVQRSVGPWGDVTPTEDGCLLEMSVDSLTWPMLVLAEVDGDFRVESPPELLEHLRRAGERFLRHA